MHPHGHGSHAPDLDWSAMVSFAEREAEVLGAVLAEATGELAGAAARRGLEIRRVLDIGCGPGVGTCVLAERFDSATVLAVDGSAEMLANVEARAARLGLAGRVTTRQVQLPDELDDLGTVDVVWASMVLHHVGDEAAALRKLRARLEPGGLLALVEFGDPMRVVPEADDLGRPGLWGRLDEAGARWLADMRAGLPGATASGSHPAMMEAAGFEVLVDRTITVQVDAPLDDRARRVALDHLAVLRGHVAPFAAAEDVAALDVLLDEEGAAGVLHRPDALLRSSRHLYVAGALPIPSAEVG